MRTHANSTEDGKPIMVPSVLSAPIVSSYNHRIRPLLDAVDKLRHLNIMQQGIQLPTIVVVGDQSSGKSSVLESLAGISLPRGQGICTRVPLIMRLQNHQFDRPEIFLEYNGKTVATDEESISHAISVATDEIAGKGKGISRNPLTLVVKKHGVPDLTMVDLPGITRVPVHGQPANIYEQISNTIMEYITPEESIILNVLSASVDFSTCESIRMSQQVDTTGQRTLAVVTKADKSPEGLLEKVTADDVSIGLGYVCVRNRIGDESYDLARVKEANLFEANPLLSKISKGMVGIPVLAQRLVKIQATIIVKCLPDIIRKVEHKLTENVEELKKMPKHMNSIAEAVGTFMGIINSTKESLNKLLVLGDFDEYPADKDMHGTAKTAEMVSKFRKDLGCNGNTGNGPAKDFLLDEMNVLKDSKSIGLPNFLPKSAFYTLLQRKVNVVSEIPDRFVDKYWSYIGEVLVSILMRHADNYPQLRTFIKRAANNVIAKKKKESRAWVDGVVKMEKSTDYTCSSEYISTYTKLMASQDSFMAILKDNSRSKWVIEMDEFGRIDIAHLRGHRDVVQEAFDLKMRMTAYWKIVLTRLVDNVVLCLVHNVKELVRKDMETEIIEEVMGAQGNRLELMLDESPSVAEKRNRLMNSIELLEQSKSIVGNIMDRVESDFDYDNAEPVSKKRKCGVV